eukprot:ANDGO_08635.mRNA.1 hypothetical protein
MNSGKDSSRKRPRSNLKGRKEKPTAEQQSRSRSQSQPTRKESRRSEIERLRGRIESESPQEGSVVAASSLKKFTELPLSERTMQGLEEAGYKTLTDVQRMAIPHALCGRDVLGAAKTGSGKTLAFVIPLIEKLYRNEWTVEDGLGVLVLTPTRELALQIFEVLRKVGKHHSFSAGLVIGGKKVGEEMERITGMNILVGTPGRVLQHLDQAPDFRADNLLMLVLDEADRCLDMGFAKTLNAIVDHLPPPPQRQTLLFSATQTKSVKDLARLSLSKPEFVSAHAEDESSTPQHLEQVYLVVKADRKLDILFQFIKSHVQHKMVVFLATTKQVRFYADALQRLKVGAPLYGLTGKMKQMKRLSVFVTFSERKNGVLLCTDLAARGLDFPSVGWVIQVDCPDSAATYIHRVGRTARYVSSGKAVMFLCPSEEEKFVEHLKDARIPIEKKEVNPNQLLLTTQNKLVAQAMADPEFKHSAEKAVMSYVRSVHLASDKSVFILEKYPWASIAQSYGLGSIPKIKVLSNKKRDSKNTPYELLEMLRQEESEKKKGKKGHQDDSDSEDEDGAMLTLDRKIFQRKASGVLSSEFRRLHDGSDEDDGGDLLQLKRKDHDLGDGAGDASNNVRIKRLKIKKNGVSKQMQKNQKIVFDEDGNVVTPFETLSESATAFELEEEDASEDEFDENQQSQFASSVKKMMGEKDKEDKERERERVKAKHKKQKMMDKDREGDDDDEEADEDSGVRLASTSAGDDDESDGEFSDATNDSDSDSEASSESEVDDEITARRAPAAKRRRTDDTDMESREKMALKALGL